MYEILDAHPVTLIVIAGSVMVTPVYLLATYVFSGASPRKGLLAGMSFLVFGALMSWICLSDAAGRLGFAGDLIVPAVWTVIRLGFLDFLGAFFFGFFSSETPLQLFYPRHPTGRSSSPPE